MKKRGDAFWGTLIPWIIGIGILFIFFILYLILSGKGTGALEALKNLLRFGP